MLLRRQFHRVVFGFVFAIGFSITLGMCTSSRLQAEELRFFIGTYTQGNSKGIYSATLDTETGKVSQPMLVAETRNPSFLAIHPNNKFLYAVGETADFQGKKSGAVVAFSIDQKTSKLTRLNAAASKGGYPCHLVVDEKGKYVLFANYGGGNVGVMPIKDDGTLGAMSGFVQHVGSGKTDRQKGPHAHSINMDANNRFAVAADLGLDQLITYRLTSDGKLESVAVHKEVGGAGPRHFTFHPNGKFGFLLNEMNATISALNYDAKTGKFSSINTLPTLPEGFTGRKSCAEVRIHPSGKFLYCSNRGHDSIAVFRVKDEGSVARTEVVKTGGKEPRNFNLDPSGKFLIAENQNSNTITVFTIDQQTGKLTSTGQVVEVPKPVCIRFFN